MIEFLGALLPSAGVLFLFVVAMRALLQADRRERAAEARLSPAHSKSPAAISITDPHDVQNVDHEGPVAP